MCTWLLTENKLSFYLLFVVVVAVVVVALLFLVFYINIYSWN